MGYEILSLIGLPSPTSAAELLSFLTRARAGRRAGLSVWAYNSLAHREKQEAAPLQSELIPIVAGLLARLGLASFGSLRRVALSCACQNQCPGRAVYPRLPSHVQILNQLAFVFLAAVGSF